MPPARAHRRLRDPARAPRGRGAARRGRALLLRIAHPAVAAAVARHSRYRADPLARLLRTLRPTLAIVFGTPAEAAARINAVHTRVAGPGYRATDPALLAWVLATLIDTALLMHDRFVRPLPAPVRARYYDEMLEPARCSACRATRSPRRSPASSATAATASRRSRCRRRRAASRATSSPPPRPARSA
ncbi:MAG: DUF2236 domain-containing protein, partial [Candidatus Rokubacteria bacterium]|nr:DUF2236 domain-containing protein [Candidatus Rokubacteria bacterium]